MLDSPASAFQLSAREDGLAVSAGEGAQKIERIAVVCVVVGKVEASRF